ncbi:MAG: hypothetical protein FWC51_01785 [Proteobacteria bacterium]|nr:hypothetical protein [Pseudomonadota bacterium]
MPSKNIKKNKIKNESHTPRWLRTVMITAGVMVVLFIGFVVGAIWWGHHVYETYKTAVVTAVAGPANVGVPAQPTCAAIETLKLRGLPDENSDDTNAHIIRAYIYADLTEYGCPENREAFAQLSDRELQIAAALHGNHASDNAGNVVVYRTAAEGEVAREARRVIEKAKQIGEPMIQFISSVEKIMSDDK